jgi:pullulanase/glycogen debranching enzyme
LNWLNWLDWLKERGKDVVGCGLEVNGLEKQHKALNWLTKKTNGTNKTNQTAVLHLWQILLKVFIEPAQETL